MLSALVLSVCVACGQAEVTAEQEKLSDRVVQLVRQLNDDDIFQRQAAEQALVELGEEILSLLPQSNDKMPQELRSRLSRVRERLEKLAAEAATQPSTVTLQGEMTLSEAVAAISKQTGNKLVDFRGQLGQAVDDPTVKVDFEEVPFWEALDAVFDQGHVRPYSYSGQLRTMAFESRGDNGIDASGRVAYAGPFRLEATRIRSTRDLRDPTNQLMRLTLDVAWEPRLQPIVITQPLDQIVATDDKENEIGINSRRSVIESSVQNTVGSVELDVPLDVPGRDTKSIALLKGQFTALMPGREADFEFQNLSDAKNDVQRNAGVAVTLRRMRKNGGIQQAMLIVEFEEASGALESHRGWVFNNQVYVVDAKDQRTEPAGFEETSRRENAIGLAYNFDLPDDLTGYKLVYTTPAAIVNLPVPYELKNIELP